LGDVPAVDYEGVQVAVEVEVTQGDRFAVKGAQALAAIRQVGRAVVEKKSIRCADLLGAAGSQFGEDGDESIEILVPVEIP
jgi:hypothetical protein